MVQHKWLFKPHLKMCEWNWVNKANGIEFLLDEDKTYTVKTIGKKNEIFCHLERKTPENNSYR